jgi:hypothetical protein
MNKSSKHRKDIKEIRFEDSIKNNDEQLLQKEIEMMVEQSQAFQFLRDEEDIYKVNDIKEKF